MRARSYSNTEYDRILNEHVGDTRIIDTVASEATPKVFAVASVASHVPPVPFLFRNYCFPDGVESRYKGSCRVPIWKALRASSAAPTYFSEVEEGTTHHRPSYLPSARAYHAGWHCTGLLRLHDGGTVANNPTAIAIHEAKRLYPNVPIDCTPCPHRVGRLHVI